MEKVLNVFPDGIERIITDTVLLLKENSATAHAELTCAVPASVDPQTVTTTINFVGDLLGDALSNFDSFLQMPHGCGEQSLAQLAPTLIVHGYMTATGQMTPDLHAKYLKFALEGFQIHLTLRMESGAYKYFYNNEGSTWLTAFTVKIFRQAQTFMTVDQNLIETALAFIVTKQEEDGGFFEDERSLQYNTQGRMIGKVSITAYIAILLTQLRADFPQYSTARDDAINFIALNVDQNNIYELAICCYALYLVDHSSFKEKYQTFLNLAIEDSKFMQWNSNADYVAVDVEIASYALLFISKFDTARSVKIARFIVSKKNAKGGWDSTQDTVMAIESLASVASLVKSYDSGLDMMTRPDVGDPFLVTINSDNRMVLQSFNLDSDTRNVKIVAEGSGSGKAIISFTCRYFESSENASPRFAVTYELVEECNTSLRIKICINYIAVGEDQRSNMVIMKMAMPSGYVYDSDTELPSTIRVIELNIFKTKTSFD